jgi:TonB family protein
MRSLVGTAALAAGFVLIPAASGHAPDFSQDFSITNPMEPGDAARRDVMRQLQAWWDQHAYYPRHASSNDEGGTVKVRLAINPDGRIWRVDLVGSSGSASLDTAGVSAFRGGFLRPFAAGVPPADIALSLRYVLAHRHDQPVAAGYKPVAAKGPFTISNDPVTSPILETMIQRSCTGTVVKEGIRNHPWYGGRHWVQAIFFRKPDDNTPWVKFYDGGDPLLAPVNEVGKMVQWTGKTESPRKNTTFQYHYTVWLEGENTLSGNIDAYFYSGLTGGINTGGTVDLTCATERVPAIEWHAWAVRDIQAPPGDPP